MTGLRNRLVATACLTPCLCLGQAHDSCGQFKGAWTGMWSQGFYGQQWIHVTEVTETASGCMAQVAYSPVGAPPATTYPIPVRDGVMQFQCNAGTGGVCRLEIQRGELLARYSDPTGFVNTGIFRKHH
ncbi:MAG: hypothetical protein KF740_19600 [Ramlibacter sp.]|nr:hypothetical protein [Ramlibacter sp.]